jgi:hypothetical protein
MPTRKIADLPSGDRCMHPEHNAQQHVHRDPGLYEHTCPACEKSYLFLVTGGPRPKTKPELDALIDSLRKKPRRDDWTLGPNHTTY